MTPVRRFPPPWTEKKLQGCFLHQSFIGTSALFGETGHQSFIGTSALFGETGASDLAVGAGRGRGSGGDNAAGP